jgi:hypothetical protein
MSTAEPDIQPATLPARRSALLAFWRPETGIFLGLCLFLMVSGRSNLFRDPGTFWHTRVGERMISSGQLIWTDPFTFTWSGEHWIGHQWLGECLMALIHSIDGLDSLLLATATLLAGLYTWVAYRFMRTGLHWSLSILLVALVIVASAGHFHIRPHLGTIVFMGVSMGYLVDFEAGRIQYARLLGLVPICLFWTSIHGGVLGGLATMALALAGWTAYGLAGRESPITHIWDFNGFAGIIAACTLTIVVSPYGIWLPKTWIAIMESQTLTQIIVEHRRLDLEDPADWIILLLGGLYLAALLSTLPRWPRVTWLLPFVWLYLAYSRIRHGPLFAITAAVALADLLPYSRVAAWLARTGSDLFQPRPMDSAATVKLFDWRPALLPILLIATTIVLQRAQAEVPVLGRHWAKLDAALWPVELLDDLRKHQDDRPDGTPIFNEYIYGGFLIYYTPGYRVFVDDRCELYRGSDNYQWLYEFVQAEKYGTPQTIGPIMRRWEQEYGRFDLALVKTAQADTEPGFDNYFRTSPEWTAIKRTTTASLYQRTNHR